MYELLKQYCELAGPAGDEWDVQNFIARRWQSRVEDLRITKVGNVIAHVGGQGPKLLIAAHADEISFVVKSIDPSGYLWITSGERNVEQRPSLRSPTFLPWGQPALVLTTSGPVEGVFATLTGHVLTPDQRSKGQMDWDDIFIDIGATSKAEAMARGVQVGDRLIWNPPTRRMGDMLFGKAMDDRAGLAVMDRLLDTLDRSRLAYDLTFVSTVQEEVGLIGAESAAEDAGCEMAISLDIGLAGDVPGVSPHDVDARLGCGPTIVHKDLSQYNRLLTLALIEAAAQAEIPIQPAVFTVYGSDSSAFTRHGLRAALVVVPARYTHSPFEMINLNDLKDTVRLMKFFLETPLSQLEPKRAAR